MSTFNTNLMLNDWWQGLQFFLSHSFYQGRRNTISGLVEEKGMNVLKKYITDKGNDATVLLNKNNFPEIRNALKKVIGKGKIGRGNDIKMIIERFNLYVFVRQLYVKRKFDIFTTN